MAWGVPGAKPSGRWGHRGGGASSYFRGTRRGPLFFSLGRAKEYMPGQGLPAQVLEEEAFGLVDSSLPSSELRLKSPTMFSRMDLTTSLQRVHERGSLW